MELKDDNYKEVINKEGVVLVDFWAEWCGPCKLLTPIIEALEAEYKDKATIAKLNVDENMKAAIEYKVRSIPTIIVFKDGEQVDYQIGIGTKDSYIKMLDKWL